MSFLESERVQELLERAGLGGLSPGALKGALAIALVVVGLGVWRFWPSAPVPEVACEPAASASASEAAAIGAAAAQEDTATAEIVVHVAGAVMHPGVYHLPLNSRVTDALAAAGGALGSAATDSVNLARLLVDGEQVYLPTQEEIESGAVAGAGSTGSASGTSKGGSSAAGGASTLLTGGLVNINTATASELDALPGIGPATAQKIIDDREANGPFAKTEDLMRVPGIGESKYDALKDLVTAR